MRATSMNQSIAKAANAVRFEVGAKVVATIKSVRDEGVNIVMSNGRGSGLISPLVWTELAWMYHDGNGVKADKSKARRFFRKAREMAEKRRQCKIRLERARLRKNRIFGYATFRGCAT